MSFEQDLYWQEALMPETQDLPGVKVEMKAPAATDQDMNLKYHGERGTETLEEAEKKR